MCSVVLAACGTLGQNQFLAATGDIESGPILHQSGPGATSQGDVTRLAVGTPSTLRDIDAGAVRGIPTRLAWSLDGKYLYLRLSTFDRWSNETVRHILIDVKTAEPRPIGDEPGWIGRYWNFKAGLVSPAVPSWKITVDAREEQVRTTNVPREGNIGQFTSDPGAGIEETIHRAAQSQQKTLFEDYRLSGHTIGSAINDHVAAGRTYGWAPAQRPFLAYVTEKGRLALMDASGRTLEVKGTKDVRLPAWSEDGLRLAFVQQSSRDTCTLKIVDIR